MRTLLVIVAGLFACAAGRAASIVYTSGTSTAGEGVGATAVFNVTSSNTFTLTLTNTLTSVQDFGQALTGMEFAVGGAGTVSETGTNGNLFYIANDGTPTPPSSTSAIAWGFGTDPSTNGLMVCTVCTSGGTVEGIVPNLTSYAGANSSILWSPNPFLGNGTVFSFTTQNTLSTTTNSFSNVVFYFGSSFGSESSPGTLDDPTPPPGPKSDPPVPEPATVVFCGAGLLGLGLVKSRRAVKRRSQ